MVSRLRSPMAIHPAIHLTGCPVVWVLLPMVVPVAKWVRPLKVGSPAVVPAKAVLISITPVR